MKVLICIIAILESGFSIYPFGCFLNIDNTSTNIYADSISSVPIFTIENDTINEIFYDFDIFGKSSNRFLVGIGKYENKIDIYGWIDKQYCGVWVRANCYYEHTPLTYIYKEPNQDSEYYVIKGDVYDFAIITDYVGKFIKVSFHHNGEKHTGYILRYCPTIYNSCH